MAWNPSPEVAAARDFGKKFGKDIVIVLSLDLGANQSGFASWGRTKKMCDAAEKLAEAAHAGMIANVEEQT